ncbi:hypothetical protein K0M31_020373 [Melipona bicolor]|uniref:Uncharacterized protein n=1 Tax=Melipona bicolor TaxID=60889 RepID=A0AA40G1C0_9HYME|nr:hypothetical protein K0M31_020373 [Melipona bicolor]
MNRQMFERAILSCPSRRRLSDDAIVSFSIFELHGNKAGGSCTFVIREKAALSQRSRSSRFSSKSATCPEASTELEERSGKQPGVGGDEEKVGKRVIRFHYPFHSATSMLPVTHKFTSSCRAGILHLVPPVLPPGLR